MFPWVKISQFQPCILFHHNGVSNNRQYFYETNIQWFDFSSGFKCSDVYKFEKLVNFSMNIFKTGFNQIENENLNRFLLNSVNVIWITLTKFSSVKINLFSLNNYMCVRVNMILNLYVYVDKVPIQIKIL